MDITKYVLENALQLIPVYYILGEFIKRTEFINDKFIPFILVITSLVFTPLVLGSYMSPENYVQAILVVGVAVLTNQVVKQALKGE